MLGQTEKESWSRYTDQASSLPPSRILEEKKQTQKDYKRIEAGSTHARMMPSGPTYIPHCPGDFFIRCTPTYLGRYLKGL